MINLKRTYSEEKASMIDLMKKLNTTRRTFKSICDKMQQYEKFIDPKILNSFEENVISAIRDCGKVLAEKEVRDVLSDLWPDFSFITEDRQKGDQKGGEK
jgi:hypothetical protein